MNRCLRASVITCFVIVSVGSILAQAPAQPAPGGRGDGRGGQRPASVATPEDLADLEKLANLPALVKGAGDGDFSTGPDYTPAPEETQRVGIPHGKLIEFFMNSASSKVFPGVNAPFERLVSVYIPAQYVPGRPAPFIFSADSYGLRDRQLYFPEATTDTTLPGAEHPRQLGPHHATVSWLDLEGPRCPRRGQRGLGFTRR